MEAMLFTIGGLVDSFVYLIIVTKFSTYDVIVFPTKSKGVEFPVWAGSDNSYSYTSPQVVG